ncbi:cation transporter [Paenibacillus silviterrae]|uniref:cation transporter n=1 Tax=Paenibacillus silviterrae TaxID=3242194 RepID=UPI002543480A|nr:heavy metal-associated domain-containing protein [Paenibacillus chinjuensis]
MNQHKVDFRIEGMGCQSCVGKIESKLGTLDGVSCKVNFAEKTAQVTITEGGASEETVLHTIQSMGYQASPTDRKE